MLVQHVHEVGALFTSVVVAVSVGVEVLRHASNEDTVRVLAVTPRSSVRLTTFIGKE